MLKEASGIKKIILRCGRTDLRKGIDGLKSIVSLHYGLDPMEEGTLFLFCGTRADRFKGLLWEGDGFVLIYKRLKVTVLYSFINAFPLTAVSSGQGIPLKHVT